MAEDPKVAADAAPTPDPLADLKAQLDQVRTERNTESTQLKSKLDQVTGQLQVLSAAASESLAAPQPSTEAPAPDIISDTDKALDFHFEKRTRPLIAQQLQREAAREKELISVKRTKDWKDFGPQVEQLIAQNRIPAETLATPGSYDSLLDLVKAKNIDAIVKERVEAEMATFREGQARSAGSSPNSPQAAPAERPKPPEESLDADQRRVAAKLGIDVKKYAEIADKTTWDGVRYRGEVVH